MTMTMSTPAGDLSPEDLLQLVDVMSRHLSKGRTAAWTAAAVGVGVDFVRGYQAGVAHAARESEARRRRSLAAPSPEMPRLSKLEESVLMCYVRLMSHAEIASHLDMSEVLVAQYVGRLRRKGAIAAHGQGERHLGRRRRVAELRSRGMRVVDIARELGMTASLASNDLAWSRDMLPLLAIRDAEGLREHARSNGVQLGDLVRSVHRARQVLGGLESSLPRGLGGRRSGDEIAHRRRRVLELHREGLDRREIGRRLGEKTHNVASDLSYLRGVGELEPAPEKGACYEPHLDDVRRLYLAGVPYSRIASELGVSRNTVRGCLLHLRDSGAVVLDRLEPTDDVVARRARVLELRRGGMRHRDIAERLCVSDALVHDDVSWLKRNGDLADVDGRAAAGDWRWPDRAARRDLRLRLAAMESGGMSHDEIARETGLTRRQVRTKIAYARECGEVGADG